MWLRIFTKQLVITLQLNNAFEIVSLMDDHARLCCSRTFRSSAKTRHHRHIQTTLTVIILNSSTEDLNIIMLITANSYQIIIHQPDDICHGFYFTRLPPINFLQIRIPALIIVFDCSTDLAIYAVHIWVWPWLIIRHETNRRLITILWCFKYNISSDHRLGNPLLRDVVELVTS